MNNSEYVNLFNENYIDKLPVNFRLVRQVFISKEEVENEGIEYIGKSDFHNTNRYLLHKFYKPVAILI